MAFFQITKIASKLGSKILKPKHIKKKGNTANNWCAFPQPFELESYYIFCFLPLFPFNIIPVQFTILKTT